MPKSGLVHENNVRHGKLYVTTMDNKMNSSSGLIRVIWTKPVSGLYIEHIKGGYV